MKKNQLYIYSGIEPGKKGAGNFVAYFIKKLENNQVQHKVISYNTPDGFFVKWSKKIGIIKFLKKRYYFFIQKVWRTKIRIENEKVVLFHPQSIGLDICIDIIKKNQTYIYVLDNFLFCKKSYNYLSEHNSCTLCITDFNAHKINNCSFFPNEQRQSFYETFIKTIKDNIKRIQFITQNDNQSILLKKKFGEDVSCNKVGMLIELENRKSTVKNVKQYDFLYHNTLSKAKGLNYFLQLAEIMPASSFAIPYAEFEVKKIIPSFKSLDNVEFLKVTWENGLADILERCKIVINPSLWSSPVEGALLKSIYYNGCVAVVSVDYAFPNEMPDNVVIKLSSSIEKSVEILGNVLTDNMLRDSYKENSKQWLNNYKDNVESSINIYIKNNYGNN